MDIFHEITAVSRWYLALSNSTEQFILPNVLRRNYGNCWNGWKPFLAVMVTVSAEAKDKATWLTSRPKLIRIRPAAARPRPRHSLQLQYNNRNTCQKTIKLFEFSHQEQVKISVPTWYPVILLAAMGYMTLGNSRPRPP